MKSTPSILTTLWTITGATAVLAVFTPQNADAQFHEKRDGQVVQRVQVPTSQPVASSRPQASYQNLSAGQVAALAAQRNGKSGGVQLISTTGPAATSTSVSGTQALSGNHTNTVSGRRPPPTHDVDAKQFHTAYGVGIRAWDLKITDQEGGEAEIAWGSAKHHPNGNYTIEKVIDETLVQRTFTPPRTAEEHQKTDDERQPIERRVVQLDARGRPAEVLIYDIRNQLKLRGVLIYDNLSGRFLEEQLLTPSNQILRRRVQQYSSAGKPLPIKTYMDEDNIHADTSLVLSGQESPTGFTGNATHDGGQEKPKEDKSLLRRMMFWK